MAQVTSKTWTRHPAAPTLTLTTKLPWPHMLSCTPVCMHIHTHLHARTHVRAHTKPHFPGPFTSTKAQCVGASCPPALPAAQTHAPQKGPPGASLQVSRREVSVPSESPGT